MLGVHLCILSDLCGHIFWSADENIFFLLFQLQFIGHLHLPSLHALSLAMTNAQQTRIQTSVSLTFKHCVWQRRKQISFQFGTWCALAQTERAQASPHASTSLTPHTVTHVSGVGSLEKAPTLLSILLEVQTRSHTNWSVDPLLSLPRSCSSSRPRLVLTTCRTTNAGTTVPTTPHHHSTISFSPFLTLNLHIQQNAGVTY